MKKRIKKSLVDQLALKIHFSTAASLLKPEFRVKTNASSLIEIAYISKVITWTFWSKCYQSFFFNVKKLCWPNQGKRIKIGVDKDRKLKGEISKYMCCFEFSRSDFLLLQDTYLYTILNNPEIEKKFCCFFIYP